MEENAGESGPSLVEIARRHGTDKDWGHSYMPFYEALFRSRRDEPVVLLEIGVGGYQNPDCGGESLRTWKEYFPLGRVIGVDYFDKTKLQEDRVTIVQGDQNDARFLRELVSRFAPFDFVVDDGSHVCRHVITSFQALFPHLKPGGWYVVEDVATSYWPTFGGSYRLSNRRTTMGYFKNRADRLNHAEFRWPKVRTSEIDVAVEEIRFRHELVALMRGENSDRNRAVLQNAPFAQWVRQERPVHSLAFSLAHQWVPDTVITKAQRFGPVAQLISRFLPHEERAQQILS